MVQTAISLCCMCRHGVSLCVASGLQKLLLERGGLAAIGNVRLGKLLYGYNECLYY